MNESEAQAKRKLDEILGAGYLQDLSSIPVEALKARRDESMQVEQEISYGRRLVQGKLDILRHALDAGEKGQTPTLRGVIDRLPEILADAGAPAGPLRHSPLSAPAPPAAGGRRELDRLAAEVSDLDEMSPEEISHVVERLAQAEKKASEQRRKVQQVIDSLNDELVSRLQEQHGHGSSGG